MSRRSRLDSNFRLIARLYPGVHTVYGPYLSKDGRYRVVLYDGTRRITRQYAKLKMELKLKRRLHEHNETVDHWDGNTRNDRQSNLRLVARKQHCIDDALHIVPINMPCAYCGTVFTLSQNQRNARAQSKSGPFCSRSCTGKANSRGLQNIRAPMKKRYVRGKHR